MKSHYNTVSFLIPDFVEIQRNSFVFFLLEGFVKSFSKRKRIRDSKRRYRYQPKPYLNLFLYPEYYQLNYPEYSPTQAVLKGKTYESKLYVPAQLVNRQTKEVSTEWVLLGNLPLMTKRGHFIINGSPRVIVNQLVRSPGIYYNQGYDTQGNLIIWGDLIPQRGTWLRLKKDKNGTVWALSKSKPKIEAVALLQSFGLQRKEIKAEAPNVYRELLLYYPPPGEKKEPIEVGHLTKEAALVKLYSYLNPIVGDSNYKYVNSRTKIVSGKKFLYNEFQSAANYNLSELGRNRLNNLFGLREDQLTLTTRDLLFAINLIYEVEYKTKTIDDIDSLRNRRVRTSGELIRNQINVALANLRKSIQKQMKEKKNRIHLQNLVTTKHVNGSLREFFGTNPLSQYMDQTNSLAEITHKRRITSLGPGGIKRESAIQVRSIHPTYYGRICPIETPEGRNAGLVNSITVYSQINSQGLLQTPFCKIYKGQVQSKREVSLFSTEREGEINLAPADLQLSKLGFLQLENVPIKMNEEYRSTLSSQVEYTAISPLQMISVATSLIPFLEHDDANRALMGSNMQRQAVPLVSPQVPIVGTGLESRTAANSGHLVESKTFGYVSYASGEKIQIQPFKGLRFQESTCKGKSADCLFQVIQNGDVVFHKNRNADESESKAVDRGRVRGKGGGRGRVVLKHLYPHHHFQPSYHHHPDAGKQPNGSRLKSCKTINRRPKITVVLLGPLSVGTPLRDALYHAAQNASKQTLQHEKGISRRLRAKHAAKQHVQKGLESKMQTEQRVQKYRFTFTEHLACSCFARSTSAKVLSLFCDCLSPPFYELQGNNLACPTYGSEGRKANHLVAKHRTVVQPRWGSGQLQTSLYKAKQVNLYSTSSCFFRLLGTTKLARTSLREYDWLQNQVNLPLDGKYVYYVPATPSPTVNSLSEERRVTDSWNANSSEVKRLVESLGCFQTWRSCWKCFSWRTEFPCFLSSTLTLFLSPSSAIRSKHIALRRNSDHNVSPVWQHKINGHDCLNSVKSDFVFSPAKQPLTTQKGLKSCLVFFATKGRTKQTIGRRFKADLLSRVKVAVAWTNSNALLPKDSVLTLKSNLSLDGTTKRLNCALPFNGFNTCLTSLVNNRPVRGIEGVSKILGWSKSIEHPLQVYERSNQETCLTQRPTVMEGDWVQKGDLLADSSSSVSGEVTLGKNVLVAYMPWEGYNFEDAILINERLVYNDVFTSIHIERYQTQLARYDLWDSRTYAHSVVDKLWPEMRIKPYYKRKQQSTNKTKHLDGDGIAKIGSWVVEGDILIGKYQEVVADQLSPYEKLLSVIHGPYYQAPIRDKSLRVPKGVEGRVVRIEVLESQEDLSGKQLPIGAKTRSRYQTGLTWDTWDPWNTHRLRLRANQLSKRIAKHVSTCVTANRSKLAIANLTSVYWKENNTLFSSNRNAYLFGGLRIRIYLAEKRRIQVGDKMSGRHGNKGIVSKILPRQDMPYLPNGSPIDIVLNPLGVPSRMNVGQVFESLLGLAGIHLNQQFKILPFDELYGSEASRSLVYSKLYQARLKTGQNWLFNPETPGKMPLFDGRTGQLFDQSVTVGQAYMLKLVHLVDHKIHARSIGPYALITQQPLRGKSKKGGQRVGEMEVWAFEGFGAAYTLQELLTVKSDDIKGRLQVMDSILYKKNVVVGRPAAFEVLIKELQCLCFKVTTFRNSCS